MKTVTLFSILLTATLMVGNVNKSFGNDSQQEKTYKNVIENKDEHSITISFFDGKNDLYIKPTKQYKITYNVDGNPIEKIYYKWNKKTMVWQQTDKYEYIYDSRGKLENHLHAEWNQDTENWNEYSPCQAYSLSIDTELLTINSINQYNTN